jgi:hypothetical protein
MDIDNATSITVTGQNVAKAGAEIIDRYLNEKYGINKSVTLYQDTDSVTGDTLIKTNLGSLPIENLYENYKKNKNKILFKGHEIINIENNSVRTLTYDSHKKQVCWGHIKNIVRHKVSKGKYKIKAKGKEVIMTEDHGCMVLRNGILLRVKPSEINTKTDKMVVLK